MMRLNIQYKRVPQIFNKQIELPLDNKFVCLSFPQTFGQPNLENPYLIGSFTPLNTEISSLAIDYSSSRKSKYPGQPKVMLSSFLGPSEQ